MASIVRPKVGSISSDLAGTALNSLASGAGAYCTEYDNSATPNLRAIVQFQVDFGTGPTVGMMVEVYFVPAIDGTTYPTDNVTSIASNPSISFPVQNTTNTQLMAAPLPMMPPCKVKPYVVNRTNQSFNSSGMELKILPITDEIAAA
jgi:hypothetical protein